MPLNSESIMYFKYGSGSRRCLFRTLDSTPLDPTRRPLAAVWPVEAESSKSWVPSSALLTKASQKGVALCELASSSGATETLCIVHMIVVRYLVCKPRDQAYLPGPSAFERDGFEVPMQGVASSEPLPQVSFV